LTTSQVRLTDVIGPSFFDLHGDVRLKRHTHYRLAGGRGSLKSTFAGVEIVLGMMPTLEGGAYERHMPPEVRGEPA
jgi:hypothetical protein